MEDSKINDILICIFNYKHDDNAKKWLNILSPYFETVVLDSGNDHVESEFIQFPNIYYSGLFNEMKKLSEKKDYKWVGLITSDVTVDDDNFKKLIKQLKWLSTTKNIGVYQPSPDITSRAYLGHNDGTYDFDKKGIVEGWFQMIKGDVLRSQPYVNVNINLYGWGIDIVTCCISIKKFNYINVNDNSVQVHHPADCGYNMREASKQMRSYLQNVAADIGISYEELISIQKKTMSGTKLKVLPDEIKYINESEKIIISMTTWEKRIEYLPTVLDSILHNKILPDKIVINLAIPNFPQKENCFPEEVRQFINKHSDIIEINWLKNDTKVWKKSIPTLYKYPNDCVICIDDDFIYPSDFIESFMNKHKEFPNNPISGVNTRLFENNIQHCGCASLDKLSYFNGYIDYLDEDIFKIGDEDTYYTWVYSQNNNMIFVGNDIRNRLESLGLSYSYSRENRLSNKRSWSIIKSVGNSKEKTNIVDYICCAENTENKNTKQIEITQTNKVVSTKSRIEQLRDDIQNGRVIRIATNKGFIWKRIK